MQYIKLEVDISLDVVLVLRVQRFGLNHNKYP